MRILGNILNTGAMQFTVFMWFATILYVGYLILVPLFLPQMTKGQFNNDLVLFLLPILGILGSIVGAAFHIHAILKKIETLFAAAFGIVTAILHSWAYAYVVVGALYA